MSAIFQSYWVRKLIGKLGVPYNRRLRVRGSPHPNDYDAGLSLAAAESNAFQNQFKFSFFTPFASSQCHLPISSRSAKIFQEPGHPCRRAAMVGEETRGQGCPRSFVCGLAALGLCVKFL